MEISEEIYQRQQGCSWDLKGDPEFRPLPFISEKKAIIDFYEAILPSFSTNVFFAQQNAMLNT